MNTRVTQKQENREIDNLQKIMAFTGIEHFSQVFHFSKALVKEKYVGVRPTNCFKME